MLQELRETGRVWLRNGVTSDELDYCETLFAHSEATGGRVADRDVDIGALRKAFPHMRLVRTIAFQKTPDVNWAVPWHQDRVIAVKERFDLPGFGNWSLKSGVWHCEPPEALLSKMLFVRLHLDDGNLEDGAMEVALGSHREGRVSAMDAAAAAQRYPSEVGVAERGDMLVLNMLTLHRSVRSESRGLRRVLRMDFAPFDLPDPLEWAHALPLQA